MDTQKLSIAIQAFIKKQSSNAAYYEENWNERKERKAYYQSFAKDKLVAMAEEVYLFILRKSRDKNSCSFAIFAGVMRIYDDFRVLRPASKAR